MTRQVVTSPLHALDVSAVSRSDAVAFIRGGGEMTFGGWRQRMDDYRRALLAHSLRPGDRVLVWMDTTPEMAAAIFAIWGTGAIAAIMDPRSAPAHFEHAIQTCAAAAVITDDGEAPPLRPEVPVLDSRIPGESSALPPLVRPLPSAPASIVFTSGSTGRPKGVTQTHGNLLRGCLAVNGYLGTGPGDRILCTVPWTFDYGYGQLLTAAVIGSTIVIPAAQNPIGMCEAITQHRPTVLAGIPSVFTYLLRGVSPFRSTDLSSIRTITNTGGTIPAPVLDDLFGLFPEAEIFLNYGLTETYRTSYLPPSLARQHPTSIGRGIPGVEVIVVGEDGRPAAPGEVGEIVHRGDFVCLGYWADPEATALSIRPDPLVPADCPNAPRVMFTGDYGLMDDQGLLFFRGRRDHQLKSMGVRVNPAEIEELLYKSGLVREAAIVGARHELIGDEICAFAVAAAGVDQLASELGRYARKTMSPYMVPRRIIVCDALPKTSTGKIDYPQLRRDAAARTARN